MYWVLGRRKSKGYVETWQGRHDGVRQFETAMQELLAACAVESFGRIPDHGAMKRLAHGPLLRGHDVQLVVGGEAAFTSVFEGIAQALFLTLLAVSVARLTAPVL